MMTPEISVVVPVYNVEPYLRSALDSLLAQTFGNWEAICINDGSTDSSWQILQEYANKDKRFKIFSQPNEGVSVARNKALELSQGKYIAFLDSDDHISEKFLEKLYDAAEQTGADLAIASIKQEKIRKKDGKFVIKNRLLLTARKIYTSMAELYILLKLPRTCFITNKLYRKSAYDMHFVPHEYFEDVLFSHQILAQTHKAVTVPEVFYYYRLNSGSVVHTMNLKKEQDYLKNSNAGLEIAIKQGWDYKRLLKYYAASSKKKIAPFITVKTYVGFKAYFLFNRLLFTKKLTSAD